MRNKMIFVLAIFALISPACGDRSEPRMELTPSTACGVIVKAYKSGADVSTAVTGKISINSGEGVVLSWSVSPATSATLSSDPSSVVGEPPVQLQITDNEPQAKGSFKEASVASASHGNTAAVKVKGAEGTKEFAGLAGDVSFVVSAKNEEKDKKASECEGRMNVSIAAPLAPVAPDQVNSSANAPAQTAPDATGPAQPAPSVGTPEQTATPSFTATLSANTTNIFAGENVALSWAVAEANGGTVPHNISFSLIAPDGSMELDGTGTSATITPAISGSYAIEASIAGGVVRSNQLYIYVRRWDVDEAIGKWVGVGVSKTTAIFGKEANIDIVKKPNEVDKAYVYLGRFIGNKTWSAITVDYAPIMKNLYFSAYITDKLASYNPFRTRAIVRDEQKGRWYAGLTGSLLYSDDDGISWSPVALFRVSRTSITGEVEHASCKGSLQKGSSVYETKNLQQICDILIDDGRVLIGADYGVYYVDDVDNFIKHRDSVCWQGISESYCSRPNELSGTLVSALLEMDGKIYAGTAKGVWVSSNKGETWTAFNSGSIRDSTNIYTLSANKAAKKLYAGGPGGVYAIKTDGSAAWQRLGSLTDTGDVYSIAVDPVQTNSIYVGAQKGVFVSRDAGNKWTNITESMDSIPTVYSLAISESGANIGIYAATSGGAFSSIAPSIRLVTGVRSLTPNTPSAGNIMEMLIR